MQSALPIALQMEFPSLLNNYYVSSGHMWYWKEERKTQNKCSPHVSPSMKQGGKNQEIDHKELSPWNCRLENVNTNPSYIWRKLCLSLISLPDSPILSKLMLHCFCNTKGTISHLPKVLLKPIEYRTSYYINRYFQVKEQNSGTPSYICYVNLNRR